MARLRKGLPVERLSLGRALAHPRLHAQRARQRRASGGAARQDTRFSQNFSSEIVQSVVSSSSARSHFSLLLFSSLSLFRERPSLSSLSPSPRVILCHRAAAAAAFKRRHRVLLTTHIFTIISNDAPAGRWGRRALPRREETRVSLNLRRLSLTAPAHLGERSTIARTPRRIPRAQKRATTQRAQAAWFVVKRPSARRGPGIVSVDRNVRSKCRCSCVLQFTS